MPWPYFCSQSGLEALWHFQRMWIGKMTASTAHYCMGHASVGRNESDSGAQSRSQAPCKGFIGTCFPHKYFYYQYFTYYLRLSHIFLVFLSHFFLVGPQAGPAGPTSTGFPGVPADRPSASTAGRAPWQPARLFFIADPRQSLRRTPPPTCALEPRLPQPASLRIKFRPFPSMGVIRGGRRHTCKLHRGVPVALLEKRRECPCRVRTQAIKEFQLEEAAHAFEDRRSRQRLACRTDVT